jgi:hypothetical protein
MTRAILGRKFSRRKFGSTEYQNKVNSETGSLGPTTEAVWKNTGTTTGAPYKLGAQPMYFNPQNGLYVTSFSQGAGPQSISFKSKGSMNLSSGFGRRKSKRKSKRKSRRKSRRKNMRSRRCKSKTKKGTRCKHRTTTNFCGHHK